MSDDRGFSARLVQVIEASVQRGCGGTWCTEPEKHDGHQHQHERDRVVTVYLTVDGALIGERDPAPGPIPEAELRQLREQADLRQGRWPQEAAGQ